MRKAKVKRIKKPSPVMAASLTLPAGWLVSSPGCGSNGFLGSEDYQRDLLGGLATWILLNRQEDAGDGGGVG